MYHLKNIKKYQLGGGRLLPGLVYQNDPKVMQALSSPAPSGFEPMMAVENLRLQRDQGRRANAQLLMQGEAQQFNEQQAKIRNEQAAAQEERLAKQFEYDKAKYGLEVAEKFQDKLTGFKYNPKHQQQFEDIMKEHGVTDQDGNMAFETSTVDGINSATKNYFKFANDGRIRDMVRDNAESDILTKDLATKQKQLEVLSSKPENRLYYDVDGFSDKLQEYTKRLEDYRNNPSSVEDLSKLKQEMNGFTFDYSEMGDKLNTLAVDKAQIAIDESKVDIESKKFDMQYKQDVLDLKQRLATNEIDQSQFDREMSIISGKYSGSTKPSVEQMEQAKIESFVADLMSKNPNMSQGEAWNIAKQQFEGKITSESGLMGGGLPAGQTYTNIPVDKDGFIEKNKVRLPSGVTISEIEDTAELETGNYTRWLRWDSDRQNIDWTTDKVTVNILDRGNGDGYVVTNSPKAAARMLQGTDKGYAIDPGDWSKEQWEALSLDANAKTIKIPLSWIGQTKQISGGVDMWGNKANTPVEFSKNAMNYLSSGMYRGLRGVNPKDPGAGAWEAASKIYFKGANLQVDGLSDREAFDGMQDDTKGLYISMAPLFENMKAQFTSGRRISTNAEKGHGEGKGFDVQMPNTFGDLENASPQQKNEILNAWYGHHENAMNYIKANFASDQSGQMGAVEVHSEGSGRNRKDTYFVRGTNGSLFKFHVYLHPSSGSGTPHLDIKVLDVKSGLKLK